MSEQIKDVALASINNSAGTQHRLLNTDKVLEYAELINEGIVLPPVTVIFDGRDYFLVDGFHRLAAQRRTANKYISCQIYDGTKLDAIFMSYTANQAHGIPRTRDEIKGIIIKMFNDTECKGMTDDGIAKHIGASRSYVSKTRKEYEKSTMGTVPIVVQTSPQFIDKGRVRGAKATVATPEAPEKPICKVEEVPTEADLEKPVYDSTKFPVPQHLKAVFARAGELKQIIFTLNTILRDSKRAFESNDLLYTFLKPDSLEQAFGNAKRVFRFAIPYAVCPFCGADVNNSNCRSCNGKGFINESMWLSTPSELKVGRGDNE
jgi:hypothetical protein